MYRFLGHHQTITVEIEQMLEGNALENYPSACIDFPWWDGSGDDDHPPLADSTTMWAHEKSTSGGYSEHIFKYAAKTLFDVELKELEYKNLR